jgi:signal transduction histidine kinase
MEVSQEEYQRVVDELSQLQEDYDQLNEMFENMGQGYEEALKLYDQAVESSRMKTDFIQQISHEIRTPLNILSGFTQILTTPGMELDEATKQEVSQGIADNTNRITNLVNKMLELADAGSEQEIERTDDVPAVQIAAQAADDSRITMATHLAFDLQMDDGTDMAMLHTNLQHATRALVLLLDNAMKFTRPAEAALAVAEAVNDKKVVLRLSMVDEGKTLAFIVEDNGIGVPPEEAERIFDEFVQLDEYYDGTGIGLTVARSIARRLGGDIMLDTTYTGGARFIYSLPV